MCLGHGRDFVIGQHSTEELRRAHHRLVDILRARRPPCGWKLSREDAVSVYVCKEIAGHIKAGWDLARFAEDRASVEWLDDFPTQQDVVPFAAAHVLGIPRASALAKEAEAAGEWWHASLRWAAIANEARVASESGDQYAKCLKSAGSALQRVEPGAECSALDKQRLEIKVVIEILQRWDPGDQAVYGAQLEPLLQSEAALEMPTLAMRAIVSMKIYPAVVAGDFDTVAESHFQMWKIMKPVVEQAETVAWSEFSVAFCTVLGFYPLFFEAMTRAKSFTWDGVFGPGGKRISDALQHYDPDTMHDIIMSEITCDGFATGPASMFPVLFHWGDLATANANTEIALANMRSIKSSAAYVNVTPRTSMNYIFQWLIPWPFMLHCLGRNGDAVEFMQETKIVPSEADETWHILAPLAPQVMKPRGNIQESFGWAEETCVLVSKAAHSLVSGDSSGIDEFASINFSPDDFTALGQSTMTNMMILHGWGCPVWVALAFERFGQSERALAFAAKSLETDKQAGGNPNQWLQSFALSCRGRILAAVGDAAEAEAAFESALAVVAGREYWFLEACVVHDLVEKVLRPSGRGVAEGEARLAAAVAKIGATGEELSLHLKQRFGGWTDEFEKLESRHQESAATKQLRAELSVLRISELRKRAAAAGIDEEVLEEAEDSHHPKTAIVAMLVDAFAAAQTSAPVEADAQAVEERERLEAELSALKPSALRKRAMSASVDMGAFEEAEDSDSPKTAIVALIVEVVMSD